MKRLDLSIYASEILEQNATGNISAPGESVNHVTLDVSKVTTEQLSKEISNLKNEVQQLKTSKYYTETAETREDVRLQLAQLEWDLKNYTGLSDIADRVEDGKVSRGFLWIWWDDRKIRKAIKRIDRFRADMEKIKKQLGITTPKSWTSAIPSLPSAKFDENGDIIIDKPANTPNKPSAQLTALKKSWKEKIKNWETPTAEEFQAMWAEWAVTNYITQYTNATPKQAKTIAMIWAGAALFYGIKRLIKDGFSAKTFLKLWWLYAGITMATWENPISFLTKFYKWWSYAIPWVISKEDASKLANSQLNQTVWKQALMESIFTWFKKPEDLTRYLWYENGQFAFDTDKFFADANVNPNDFYENVLSNNIPVWKDVLLSVLCAYKKQKPWELNKIINDYLVWDLQVDGSILKDPNLLKTKVDDYRKLYKKDLAIRKQEFFKSNPGLKVVADMEALVDQEIMKKDSIVDANGKVTKNYHYDIPTIAGKTALETTLKQAWLIEAVPYGVNTALQKEDEAMLNKVLNHMINQTEKDEFIKWFLEAKSESGANDLKIVKKGNDIYIQNSWYKVPLVWDSNKLIVDFSRYLGGNKVPFSFTSYKDAILFGTGLNKLFDMSVGKIDDDTFYKYETSTQTVTSVEKDTQGNPVNKTTQKQVTTKVEDKEKIQNSRPFSYSGSKLTLYNNNGTISQLFSSGLSPINNIFSKIGAWEGNLKNQITALATALNSLTYADNNNKPIYVEFKGKLPEDIFSIWDNGLPIIPDGIWRTENIQYAHLYELFKLKAGDVINDIWNWLYNIVRKTAQWSIEMIGLVVTWHNWKTSVVELSKDIRNNAINPAARKLYSEVKTWINTVQGDLRARLITEWAKWYSEVIAWWVSKLAKDIATFVSYAGIQVGDRVKWLANRAIDNIPQLAWRASESVQAVLNANPMLRTLILTYFGSWLTEWSISWSLAWAGASWIRGMFN